MGEGTSAGKIKYTFGSRGGRRQLGEKAKHIGNAGIIAPLFRPPSPPAPPNNASSLVQLDFRFCSAVYHSERSLWKVISRQGRAVGPGGRGNERGAKFGHFGPSATLLPGPNCTG